MAHRAPIKTLARVTAAIVSCERCARLRELLRSAIAREKRAAYRDEEYWGKPVPGFGDPRARVLILGLAPAAHGANRTGRVFTGDGVGGSGDFLMAALHRAGFANITTSTHRRRRVAVDRTPTSRRRCAARRRTTSRCPRRSPRAPIISTPRSPRCRALEVVVALGKIAWDAWFQHLARRGTVVRPRPAFAHGAEYRVC